MCLCTSFPHFLTDLGEIRNILSPHNAVLRNSERREPCVRGVNDFFLLPYTFLAPFGLNSVGGGGGVMASFVIVGARRRELLLRVYRDIVQQQFGSSHRLVQRVCCTMCRRVLLSWCICIATTAATTTLNLCSPHQVAVFCKAIIIIITIIITIYSITLPIVYLLGNLHLSPTGCRLG